MLGGGGRRAERGAAAVEFALVAPLLLLLVFGIVSYGYMLAFRQAISQAAAEGARAAAVAPATVTDADRVLRAVDAINQGLGSYGVTCATGSLRRGTSAAGDCAVSAPQPCSGSSSVARCVEVRLSYTYEEDSLVPPMPGLGILLPERLTYTTEVEVAA